MITLTRKLKKDPSAIHNECVKRATIRDRLLVKEAQEMEQNLPATCKVYFSDPNILSEFSLTITPEEGYWKDGKFKFTIYVPEEYNMTVSLVMLCQPANYILSICFVCVCSRPK